MKHRMGKKASFSDVMDLSDEQILIAGSFSGFENVRRIYCY